MFKMSIKRRTPVKLPSKILSSFVSNMRFKICLVIEVSSSDMIPDKGIVNFWGPPGTGKTTFFKNIPHIPFDHDILKSKEKTIDFLQRMNYSKLPLVLDDFELVETLTGISELKGRKNYPFYIISNEKIGTVPDCIYYEHIPNIESFAESIGIKPCEVQKRLEKTNGNMTTVKLDHLFFDSERDTRYCPKSYVSTLLTLGENKTSTEFLDRVMFEHGNTLGIIHENYLDYSNSCGTLADIANSFSIADMIDKDIYSEISWHLVTYFNVSSCLIPATLIKKEGSNIKKKKELRPGSIWTKYSNACMKSNRLKRLKVSRDCIDLCIKYINIEGLNISFDSYDLDTLNQLSLLEKIKPKILTKLKAELKSLLK